MAMQPNDAPGVLMARESAEAADVFARTAGRDVAADVLEALDTTPDAIYTFARGSSDAAANILSYEFMRELRIPVTSLPPSVFSLGAGAALGRAMALVISQSGASEDLVRAARGVRGQGTPVLSITNATGAPVAEVARLNLPIGAGPEHAVPATKTVVGSIAAGLGLLAALHPTYRERLDASLGPFSRAEPLDTSDRLKSTLLRARNVFVVGRDTGYGAAQEVALKLKECCALHAEAYSASEVLHGPLQLATNPLAVLILDTGTAEVQDSLDQAEARFREAGCAVERVTAGPEAQSLVPAAAAAMLLVRLYPVVLEVALALGFDPDRPETLSKVTQTV